MADLKLLKRFLKPSKSSEFIFGPRGTGKTSWTLQEYPDAVRIDLLNYEEEILFESRPNHIIEIVEANPKKNVFIIDEIQKIPKLLETVHLLTERNKKLRFILTGSSARKLRMKGVNLLAGRAIERRMHPFMAAELEKKFSIQKALTLGMLPLIWGAPEPEKALATYVSLYIKEEVQFEALTRDIGGFGRFLESISFSQGNLLNLSNLSRECFVKRKTVENYVQILEDILLGFKLNVFTKKAQRELTSHPKFYFFDCGVYRNIRPKNFLDTDSEIAGPGLETLVVQHLRAWCDYTDSEHHLYYWRTTAGDEVDFILYGETGLYAIEVKHAKNINKIDHCKSLYSFQKNYPSAKLIILYQGPRALKVGDVYCLPVEKFLTQLVPNKSIPLAL